MDKINEINEQIIKRQEESIELLKSLLMTKNLIISELKEQLRIGGVSQQRELLCDFIMYYDSDLSLEDAEMEIGTFMQMHKHNCG